MRLRFTKMQGLGNDFIVFDGIRQSIKLSPDQARCIADRKRGIGCDQILIAEKCDDEKVDFVFRILNADGSEVGQCGNGARCFARFVISQGLTEKRILTVRTKDTEMTLEAHTNGEVTVDMGIPVFDPSKIPFDAECRADSYPLQINGTVISIAALAIGNPHAVQVVDDVDDAPLERQGPLIESHKSFPNRVNAGYVQIINRSRIKVRVYERGVGETLACGSGACAAVVAGRRWGLLDERVNVALPGGDLSVQWREEETPVLMTGPGTTVFEGEIDMVDA